jgi:hypothetical protein
MGYASSPAKDRADSLLALRGCWRTLKRMIQLPMTEAQFATATRRLGQNGIELTGRSGTLTKDGITAQYTYDGKQLSIEITDRPFFLPLSLIEGRLQAYLDQSVALDQSRASGAV